MMNGWRAISQSVSHDILSDVHKDNAALMTTTSSTPQTWSVLSCKRWRVVVDDDVIKALMKDDEISESLQINRSHGESGQQQRVLPASERRHSRMPLWLLKFYFEQLEKSLKDLLLWTLRQTQCWLSSTTQYRELHSQLRTMAPLLTNVASSPIDHDRHSTIFSPLCRNRSWYIQATCATSGDGLYEGLDWLSNQLKNANR